MGPLDRLPLAVRAGLAIAAGVAAMALLMAWLAGAFTSKVPPGPSAPPPRVAPGAQVLEVRPIVVPVVREVTGTVMAEHEATVAAQVLGRAIEVRATPGEHVTAGQVLVRLDPSELQARVAQAEAQLRQAEDRLRRVEALFQAQAIPESEVVQARTSVEAAHARATEARAVLGYTEVRAPADGVVIERLVEVGDTVTPGRPLVRMFDRLQLVAVVPESLARHVAVGQVVGVRIDALGLECEGAISEVVPQAEAVARAFKVKVSGPCPAGVIPGMFGRMRVPLGTREELRVPAQALRRVGQVTTAFRVLDQGQLLRQFVQTGEQVGDQVVITTGLQPGDRILASAEQASAAQEAP